MTRSADCVIKCATHFSRVVIYREVERVAFRAHVERVLDVVVELVDERRIGRVREVRLLIEQCEQAQRPGQQHVQEGAVVVEADQLDGDVLAEILLLWSDTIDTKEAKVRGNMSVSG